MWISQETQAFVREHRTDDPRSLALQARKYPDVDMPVAVTQIAGWQMAMKKIPAWGNTEGLWYPKHLSLEQCSSEVTARYKAGLLRGDSLADLTGGLGVDCAFLSAGFKSVTYVERQEELCEIAEHNFPLLGLPHIRVRRGDGTDYLRTMDPVDCLFLDPARRDGHGGKTVAIADCEPDVARLEELLLKKAGRVLVKLSPMLDLSLALRELPHAREAHVLSVDNECKELLLLLGSTPPEEIPVRCVNLSSGGLQPDARAFTFTRERERDAECRYAVRPGQYLYEPNASILKGGAYKSVAEAYALSKLHPNSHLYTSDTLVNGFPGRIFRVAGHCGFNKNETKALLDGLKRANLTVRNFPSSVGELRKRLKLSDGGDNYLFATTLYDGNKVLIRCRKV